MRDEKMTEDELEDQYRLRSLNDQIMLLERVFLLDGGLPGREYHRHILFSPMKNNIYGGAAFPGISDLLFDLETLSGEEKIQRGKEMQKHLSDIMIILRQAASWLATSQLEI